MIKILLVLLFFIVVFTTELDPRQQWEDYLVKFDIAIKPSEHEKKFKVFTETLDYINKINSDKKSNFKLKLYRDAHLTIDEKNKIYFVKKTSKRRMLMGWKYDRDFHDYNGPIPQEVDWRKWNVVTSVKSQGSCGSCWAFAATSIMESQVALTMNFKIDLSPQQLVDCWMACPYGSTVGHALDYSYDHGMEPTMFYPYVATTQNCRYDPTKVYAFFNKPIWVFPRNATAFTAALAVKGPLSVAINASSRSFSQYKSGVIDKDCAPRLNHAVAAVAYGTWNGLPYLTIKNSWGSWWGDRGFANILRTNANMCGVLYDIVYASIKR